MHSLLIFPKIKLFEKRDIKHENYFKKSNVQADIFRNKPNIQQRQQRKHSTANQYKNGFKKSIEVIKRSLLHWN